MGRCCVVARNTQTKTPQNFSPGLVGGELSPSPGQTGARDLIIRKASFPSKSHLASVEVELVGAGGWSRGQGVEERAEGDPPLG